MELLGCNPTPSHPADTGTGGSPLYGLDLMGLLITGQGKGRIGLVTT